jgi:FtsP/CotA-like multicopper oxidase with cupredoxin domain
MVLAALSWGAYQGRAAADRDPMPQMTPKQMMEKRVTAEQRKAAAANRKKAGLTHRGAGDGKATGSAARAVTPLALAPAPGATPDYFGPYSNWANSPLPQGPINPLVTITNGGGGYAVAPLVTISDVYGLGTGATATATVDAFGMVSSVTLTSGGNNLYAGPVVTIAPPPCATVDCVTATASATIAGAASYTGGLRKFMDTLPNLAQAIPDITTYPGTDYYEIELVEYDTWLFHLDLPATKLRGYHQTNLGTNTAACGGAGPACTPADNTQVPPPVSYLGPTIIATKGRPTRIKFTNNLPIGAFGDLFIPVDTTVMGAGTGYDPKTATSGTYPQNRGTLHLHGGFTPWVSDGTPHQWVTPAGEGGNLTTGVSTQPVPDMDLPAGNSMTFYWPNQQSGRLMFYHDHAYGITRLNVYAGEAAGYLLVDPVERQLTDGTTGTIPAMADVPLVIQDKSFVWGSQATGTGTWATDPTWNWGQAPGSLWFPHVYMPNQNPWDITGANAMGRWDYALWFWPPYTGLIKNDVLPNPYYGASAPWEPPFIPGTPNPSLVPEAFMDTPLVNGKAYPTTPVLPKPYRLRILNACNDRFLNLSFFVADPAAVTATPVSNTEVKMVPFNSSQNLITKFPNWWYTPGLNFTFDDRAGGVPDPTTRGPAMIQIGTEGGLLPAPALIRNQPVNYTYNRRDIVVLSVQEKALFLGPAERADVIVDFSNFAGKTLILYNDAPAPVPAADQRIDYYTGGADQTDTGGAPPTLPGYGPNTRTVMQIVVGGTGGSAPVDDVNVGILNTLKTALPAAFAASQDPIVVPQVAYNAAYPATPTAADKPGDNVSRISDLFLNFTPLGAAAPLPTNMEPKAIQELFELDYGRMNATLGVELKFTNGGNQTTIPLGYIDPATETIDASLAPAPPALGDGTQIWKITHNGVDTHAIHVHLFNVQVINRVGWDGAIRLPDPNELGWKETVRMNPLEDIIVALRPTAPLLPFGLPDSVRLMDVTSPPNTSGQFSPVDAAGNPVTTQNVFVNFGWEYVWHCHLLGHEENDMMRPTVFNVPRALPGSPDTVVLTQPGAQIRVQWTDTTPFAYTTGLPLATLGNPANEIGFRVERSTDGVTFSPLGNALANATSYADLTLPPAPADYWYRVIAYNAAGEVSSAAARIRYVVIVPPTVTFTGAPATAAYNTTFTVTASTNASTMPTLAAAGTCSVGAAGGTPASATAVVTMLSGTGSCLLTASWLADTNFAAASLIQSTTATRVATAVSQPTHTPTSSIVGQAVAVGFSVTPATGLGPTGTVTVTASTGETCAGAALATGCSLTFLTTGSRTITATYVGDANFAGSTSPASTAHNVTSSTYLAVSPNPLAFGDQLVGTNSAARTVAVSNTGPATLTFTGFTFTGPFSRNGGSCNLTLAAGRACTVNVRFSPVAPGGPATGTLSIASNDVGSPAIVTLTGNGVAPIATVSTGSLTFSSPLNVTSASQTVTVQNTGTAPLAINNVTRTGANGSQFAAAACGAFPVSVPPNGGTCVITVTFTPTSASSPKTATLNVVVAAPATNQTVALTGNVVAPIFTLTPTPLAFGNQTRGTTSAPQVVTVTNTGTAPLRISNVTRTGANPGQFGHTTTCGPFPATLTTGSTCTVSVTFSPTSLGLKNASLNVVVAAPGTNQSVPLSGTGN